LELSKKEGGDKNQQNYVDDGTRKKFPNEKRDVIIWRENPF
jgi:hypothetical protein